MSSSSSSSSSWLYLSEEEPYRRISVYENMRWNTHTPISSSSSSSSSTNYVGGENGELSLGDCLVSVCPNGGPIAIARDSRKVASFRRQKGSVIIFTASGALLCEIEDTGENSGRIVFLGWSSRSILYVCYSSGLVEAFDQRGNRSSDRAFGLLPSLTEEEISHCVLAGDGFAALSESPDGLFNLHLVYNLESPNPVVARDTGLPPGVRPTCLGAIDGTFTEHGRMEVLLATPDRSISVVTSDTDAEDARLDNLLTSVITKMAISPSGKYIATFGEDATMTVLFSDFGKKALELHTRATVPPEQILWCANDAIVMVWRDKSENDLEAAIMGGGRNGEYDDNDQQGDENGEDRWVVQLVGPYGDSLNVEYFSSDTSPDGLYSGGSSSESSGGGGIYCVQESDCVRVISTRKHEILQRVSQSLRNIRSIGSMAPAAILTDASHAFSEGDAKCDNTIRMLINEGRLRLAISECIDGALNEWDPELQQNLLRAASYGKSFEVNYPRDEFVHACRKIRVLNHLRMSDIALPLTFEQFDTLTPTIVIERLVLLHLHGLALLVCDYLNIPNAKDKVLVHWACAKVAASQRLSDESICELLKSKLAGVAGVSWADIAASADGAGRRHLATLILDFEPSAADQVPILLRMREGKIALERALLSGDTDLTYLALNHIRRSLLAGIDVGFGGSGGNKKGNKDIDNEDDSNLFGPLDPEDDDTPFIKAVLPFPQAIDLLVVYATSQDDDLLLKLQLASGRFADAGKTLVALAYSYSDLKERVKGLRKAMECFKDGEKQSRSVSSKNTCSLFARVTEEQIALIISQNALEKELDEKDVSIEETVGAAPGSSPLLDTPLAETIFKLLLIGESSWSKKADKLAKDFKMSDSQYAFLRIRAFAQLRDWPTLWAMANEKKSPVGYRPFAEACILGGSNVEAKKYVMQKMSGSSEYNDRMEILSQLKGTGLIEMIELAKGAKDLERLEDLQQQCNTPASKEALEKAISALTR